MKPKDLVKAIEKHAHVKDLESKLARIQRANQSSATAELKQRVLLETKRGPKGGGLWDLLGLARVTDAKIADLEAVIVELKGEGYDIDLSGGTVHRDHEARAGHVTHNWRLKDGGWVRFGVLGDTQLGNRHQRLDVLATAYEHYKAEGIDTVYHTGNLIDGYHPRFNAFELLQEAGSSMESQSAYAAAVYPKVDGITTHFITGECHEGWWSKRIGVNIGRFMEDKFRLPEACTAVDAKTGKARCAGHLADGTCTKHGRTDLRYIGHTEADVEIRHQSLPRGVRGPIVRVIHPGGGTSYAISYKTQKLAESLQGGEKPNVQFVGHFHKYDCHYHREVYSLQTGCLSDQSIFMRKQNIAAHVGYLLVEMFVGRDGVPARFRHEWRPFYDKNFYQTYKTW